MGSNVTAMLRDVGGEQRYQTGSNCRNGNECGWSKHRVMIMSDIDADSGRL